MVRELKTDLLLLCTVAPQDLPLQLALAQLQACSHPQRSSQSLNAYHLPSAQMLKNQSLHLCTQVSQIQGLMKYISY
jgi:hypothetical protein